MRHIKTSVILSILSLMTTPTVHASSVNEIDPDTLDTNIDPDTLGINTEWMDEIVITAQKPLVKMTADQMTYNVSEDSDAKTQTLLEMLRKVPLVTVDGEDNITVNGSSNFQVYVDGKPSLLFSGNPAQMFKAMPASAVKSIEVVTNPGARYDAEGAGGVLNLIFDRQSGTPSIDKAYNVSLGIRGGNKGFGGNIYANAKTGKLTASLNAVYNKNMPGSSVMETNRRQGDGSVDMYATGKPRIPFSMGSLSLEYEIDPLTTIGGSFAINGFSMNSPTSSLTTISNPQMNFSYGSNTHIRNNRTGLTGSLDFSRFFDPESRNHLTVTYQIQSERNNNKTVSDFDSAPEDLINLTDRISDNKERTLLHILQTDFSSKINSKNTVTVGAKLTLRNAKSDADYYLDDSFNADGSMRYDNRNTI